MFIVDFDGEVVGTYREEDLAFGRRPAGVVSPYSEAAPVDARRAVAEANEDALMSLPTGWQDFTPVEVGQWVVEQRSRLERGLPARRYPVAWDMQSTEELMGALTIEAARRGHVQQHGERSGQGAPKGSHEDAWKVYEPVIPSWCRTLTYLDTELPDRQPGDGWFGGSRPGSVGMYRDEEQAAGRVIYHDDEPVVPEQPAVTWRSYPSSWDVPDDHTGLYNGVYDKPRIKEGHRENPWAYHIEWGCSV